MAVETRQQQHMEPRKRSESLTQFPAEEDVSQSIGQTSINPLEDQSHHGSSQDLRNLGPTIDNWEVQQMGGNVTSLQLEFQDSRLSPALALLPSNPGAQHNFTEYSLFQQTDLEFAPLRASPDISVASERFHIAPQDRTSQASDHGSLSQHPLAHATGLSEDGASSCCSLSQHSMSPGDEGRHAEMVRSPADDKQGSSCTRDEMGSKERDGKTQADPPDKPMGVGAEDDTSFLSGDIPARQLLELLQKDIGMPSGSSSAVSSASETSLKRTKSFGAKSKSTGISQPDFDKSGASPSLQQTRQGKSHPRMSEISNITFRSSNTQADNSSEALHRELLSEVEKRRNCEAGPKTQQQGGPTLEQESFTPNVHFTGMYTGKPSVTQSILAGVCGTGPRFSAGYSVERGQWERHWSSGNQTGIEGSFLGFLPQSQSTPAVFNAPMKPSTKALLGRLSAIESNMETSGSRVSTRSPVAMADIDATDPHAAQHGSETPPQEATSEKVQALPSLNYMQKVDAWRANQSSGKASLFDNLALEGFSGVSPEQRAHDVVSDSLNSMLNQQGKGALRLPVSSTTNQNLTLNPSVAHSGHSTPQRGEAVGSAPNDKDVTLAAAGPFASPLGRSQSHSSLSTVIASIQQAQQMQRLAEQESSQESSRTKEHGPLQSSGTVQPSPLMSLGRFSDVSFNRDMSGTHSNSQDSYNSGQNLGASRGASSVVSLEVDNYVPYWGSKPTSPPPTSKARELNIEERIPLYLHNLGIDQSPSTILTPFAPRGPIREPEFSPTDLCTIKGSIGTPTKSTQPSEGGSPNKGDFSRSSLLSVDSSMSVPLSMDSLYPVSFPEQTRASPSSDTAGSQGGQRTAPSSQLQDAPSLPALQPNQQQQRELNASSQNTIQLGDRVEASSSSLPVPGYKDRDLESPSQSSHSIEQSNEDSSVGSKTLKEIRELLGQAEDIISGGSSMASASSSSGWSHLHSDDDVLLSLRRKTGGCQESFFTSSAAGGSGTHSSLLWARSFSDSMLTEERLRESSVGRESVRSPGQAVYQSAQALSTPPASDAYMRPQDVSVSVAAGSSLLLSKSARRAEPEGCSSVPPDNTGPVQPPVVKPAPAASKPQSAPGPRETTAVAEEMGSTQDGPAESVSSSSSVPGDPEQGVMSDGSSESSLAARVAKLLQSESPVTVVSSRPSTADLEESRAREWIKLKVSGQQCEPLELDIEDRKRIEEIKRELLLTHPLKSQASTDTDSSVVSSLGGPGGQPVPEPAQPFTALRAAEDRLSHQLRCLTTKPFDSDVLLHSPLRQDLEARVQEIAVREGVTLPRVKPPSLTSITITTCRRSSSPSPSPSPAPPLSPAPEPLRLNQLSTGTVTHHTASRQIPDTVNEEDSTASTQATPRDPVPTSEPNSSLYTGDQSLLDPQSEPQGSRDALGGHQDRSSHSSQTQEREDVNVVDGNTRASWRRDLQDTSTAFRKDDQGTDEPLFPSRYSTDVGHGVDGAIGSSSVDPPTRTGHISHLHLTLSPKADEQSPATGIQSRHAYTGIQSRHAYTGPGLQSREFAPLRPSSIATSSPDEGIGLTSPVVSHETREPIRTVGVVPERADTSMLFKTIVPEGEMTSKLPQSLVPPQRLAASPRPLAIQRPAVPVLLPFKPHGSEELFYVPQTEAQVSPARSDSTMESSHPGSDDAVAPRFSSEVLGSQDPGLDRGITIRHSEGIYSKRLKTATFKMQTPGHRGATVSVDGSSQTSASRAPHPSSQSSGAFTRVPLSSTQGPSGSRRDQGTSPVQFLSYNQAEESQGFRPVHMERGHTVTGQHPNTHFIQRSVPQAGTEGEQARRNSNFTQPASRQTCSTLDQLWRMYSERWSLEGGRPTNEREALLLERLERLSRLIHSTPGVTAISEPEDNTHQHPHTSEQGPRGRIEDDVLKRRERKENMQEMVKSVGGEGDERIGKADRKAGGGRKVEGKTTVPRQAWMQETQVQAEAAPHPTEEDSPVSLSSSPSHSTTQSPHLCPAERDVSETNSSMSTVDTARLIQAFGASRVRRLKTGSSLSKLYSAIDKQREDKEQRSRRGKTEDTPPSLTLPETDGTDDSIVAPDSASSTSTKTLPSQRGPSQSLAAKKAVKLVSRGIQAGDLEIVSNGTRRHTRDVGTTFPSPGLARGSRKFSASSSSSVERSSAKPQVFPKERKSKRGQSKRCPQGVSWFVPAEELRAEARKENQPEEEWVPKPSYAWFEPYRRTYPWREPLRQRQVQEDRQPADRPQTSKPSIILTEPESRGKTTSSGLVRITLQEALELRRPEFISQSRERLKCLALQVEERKIQTIFSRERDELFNHPGGPGRLPKHAAVFRRAVPRKEMVQRSKQIYEKLPEVQRRREEERRKAEYCSYRLNAQLYNMKITNRLLGRRTPWQ